MYGNSKTLWVALANLSFAFASPLALKTRSIAARDTSNSTYPEYVHPANGVCMDYTVKDTITFPQLGWDYPIYKDNYDVAAFLFNLSSSGKGMGVFNPFSAPQNVTKTYEISGTFCKPKTLKYGKEKTVLVATHGFGFDRRYWASSYKPEDYSFAQYMLDAGYSIFYYDRLGVGLSQRVSGFENQAEPEVILLARLMQEMRKGQYTDDVQASKLVIVGHSFGSSLSNSALSQFPDVADAAVLTGIAYANKTDIAAITPPYIPSVFGSRIASTLPPTSRPQFADTFDTGYLGFGDIYAYVETFLRQPHYEVAAAQYSFSVAQPLGVAEFLTAASMDSHAPDFKGRIMITSGQYDLILCDGDCYSVYKYGTQNETFSGASERVEYVQPDAGHGQNFHENSGVFFGEVVKFLNGA